MFDSNALIEVSLRTDAGLVTVTVRFPNDQEWADRMRGRKILIKRLGRGLSETEVRSETADAKLYESIRQEDAPALEGAEATRLVDGLARCEVTGVEANGNEAVVELGILSGQASHRLRIPTAKQVIEFRRAAYRMLDLPYNRQELRTNLEAGVRLWDACTLDATGYANGVPGLHKDVAIRALIDYADAEVEGKSEDF